MPDEVAGEVIQIRSISQKIASSKPPQGENVSNSNMYVCDDVEFSPDLYLKMS